MTRTSDLQGGTVGERYVLLAEVGRGGMATVYRARDLRHGGEVALKILREDVAAVLGRDRFAREIRITSQLEHPNILPVLDAGEVGGLPFYVMPFVDGETLQVRLQRDRRLPVLEAVWLAAEIADALSHAHSIGVVHRDLKPSNILLWRGHALLADFGIARHFQGRLSDPLTDSGLAVGTAHYMSPEQSLGKVDGRSDTYSLGCVLFEMLVGKPPFTGDTLQEIMARHASAPVPSIRALIADVPPALEDSVNRALSKLPADRFADAGAFRSAIQGAAARPAWWELLRKPLTGKEAQ